MICIFKAIRIFGFNFIFVSQHSCDSCVSDLHLSALSDGNILDGFVRYVSSDVLDLFNDIHAVNNLSKDHMLAIEMRQRHSSDEELAAVCVWTRVLVKVHVSLLRRGAIIGNMKDSQPWTASQQHRVSG